MKLIETINLCKSFNGKQIIRNLNLNVEAGDIYGFLGPNGAGKTTTIRMIMGLIHPDSGEIRINGIDIKKDFKGAIANVGAIVENPVFYSYLSGYENLMMIANLTPNVLPGKVDELLAIVGLQDRANDKVSTYSLGMKQRLGIAQALLGKPKVVILDEPTNGLDPSGIKEIREMIKRLAKEQNITFFISTHLLAEVQQLCNKVVILKDGSVIMEDYVDRLLENEFDVLDVYTTNIDKGIQILKNVDFIKSVEKFKKGITVKLPKENVSQLHKYFVNNDVNISYVIPQNNSLEDFFLELTKGGVE